MIHPDLPESEEIERLGIGELRSLVEGLLAEMVRLREDNASLRAENAALKEKIARLKACRRSRSRPEWRRRLATPCRRSLPRLLFLRNSSENDLRTHVIKHKISGGTKSDPGRLARDVLLGLSFFAYLGDRLGVPGAAAVPALAQLVRTSAPA